MRRSLVSAPTGVPPESSRALRRTQRFPRHFGGQLRELKERIVSGHFASDVTDNIWKEAKQKWDQISYTFNYLPDSEAIRNCTFFANIYATVSNSDVQSHNQSPPRRLICLLAMDVESE